MQKKKVEVTKESATGLNQRFRDKETNREMTRGEFADAIERGKYPGYHVEKANNKRVPRSNPDKSKGNNLG
ncbi:MAG: hypothetical protein RH862_00010 [Leptospiraceae bacterium]